MLSRVWLGRGSALIAVAIAVVTVTAAASAKAKPKPKPPKPQPLTIAGLSTAAPGALTPLTITAGGLKAGAAVVVRFADAKGFDVRESPISVSGNKTIVAAVPAYLDQVTDAVSTGTVSLTIAQAGRSSAAQRVRIQALPSPSADGLQLGEVSHAFLVYNALLLGRRINQLEAAQYLLGVDISGDVDLLTSLLKSTVLARNDVDRILLDNSTTLAAGTMPDGTPIQFDQSSVQMMDDVLSSYLLQTFPNAPAQARESAAARSSRAEQATALKGIVRLLTAENSVSGAVTQIQESKNFYDPLVAATQGAASVVASLGLPGAGFSLQRNALRLAENIGTSFAIFDVLRAGWDAGNDLLDYYHDSTYGGDPAKEAADLANLEKHRAELLAQSGWALCSAATLAVRAVTLADVCDIAHGLIDTVGESAEDGVIGGLQNALGISDSLFGFGAAASDDPTIVTSAMKNPFPSRKQGFTDLTGTASITNNQGIAAAQSSLDLCCFGAYELGIDTIADPGGSYDLVVPVGAPQTDYTGMTLSVGDLFTGNTLDSATVDLSSASTTVPLIAPPLSGTCIDTDDLNPDADDPDCD